MSTPSYALAAPVASVAFARHYIVTMRPYLLYVSGITGIAGMSAAPEPAIGATLSLSLACFLSYGFGQALTDCFQLDTDALSAPYRPLVRGLVRRRDVLAVSLCGLGLVATILAASNPLNAPITVAAIGGLASYTWFKRRWWGGPFYNAWIVAALCTMGFLGAAGDGAVVSEELLWTVLASLFLYANFVLTGYFKDISADRATGYRTLPVAFGTRAAAFASDAIAAGGVASACVAIAGARHVLDLAWTPFAACGLFFAIQAQVRIHRVGEADAHRAIAPVVHAYILLLAAIVAASLPAWMPALVLFTAGYFVTLSLRPMREQI
jgi:4-hydroxybenzoate polyprenyltransferase